MSRAANCPADVNVSMEINNVCHQVRPLLIPIIPKVMETDRYPSPMANPAFNPLIYSLELFMITSGFENLR